MEPSQPSNSSRSPQTPLPDDPFLFGHGDSEGEEFRYEIEQVDPWENKRVSELEEALRQLEEFEKSLAGEAFSKDCEDAGEALVGHICGGVPDSKAAEIEHWRNCGKWEQIEFFKNWVATFRKNLETAISKASP